MFERFTERARAVVTLAQEEARSMCHGYIGTEHILGGLLLEEDGVSACVLREMGMTVEAWREDMERICDQSRAEAVTGQIPFTPRAKKVLELALREALSLGHNYIGTEHILLGLLREGEGIGQRILTERGLDSGTITDGVIRMLSGPSRVLDTTGQEIQAQQEAVERALTAWFTEERRLRDVYAEIPKEMDFNVLSEDQQAAVALELGMRSGWRAVMRVALGAAR
jgi:ATP-dependent Clp protease ATP-binding subunit ClpC